MLIVIDFSFGNLFESVLYHCTIYAEIIYREHTLLSAKLKTRTLIPITRSLYTHSDMYDCIHTWIPKNVDQRHPKSILKQFLFIPRLARANRSLDPVAVSSRSLKTKKNSDTFTIVSFMPRRRSYDRVNVGSSIFRHSLCFTKHNETKYLVFDHSTAKMIVMTQSNGLSQNFLKR